jgi:hypothetical protein
MTLPDPITWGHLLMALGVAALLYALVQLVTYLRHRAHGRGTPGYARARDGRRLALIGAGLGAALFALGCLTPLCEAAIA